jgi:predicted Zn-dependent protease
MAALDKMSPPTGKERTSDFRKRANNTGMYMKTKDRPSPAHRKARMLQKTQELCADNGNVVGNKGS